uniref:D-serine dehydratase-like domain-containing protein n=1 Tax=Mola mola TaxID=94237 RepID=A0A3Q3WYX7_MOLML
QASIINEALSSLCSPALVLDVDKVKINAQRMIDRCDKLGVQLRPHMKTHKTLECADIMTAESRRCIVVSTLAEACFYADHGFDDILYAYCLPFDKVERCAALSERLDLFQVLLDHPDALEQLKKRPLRDGRLWHSEGVELTGVYAHCGNSYHCRGLEQIQAVAQETTKLTLQFMEKLKAAGVTCKSSIGSTPSCSHPVRDMAQLSEVHPGNYAFYDAQQSVIGSCSIEDVAVRVLTRVIGHSPHRNQLLIDCGWSGISQEGVGKLPTGCAVIEGHPHLKLVYLTQEHGIVEPTSGLLDYSKYPLGSLLRLIPYHACATTMMHSVYHIYSKGRLVGKWTPTRGW